ncbi:CDGSH iron-sulfur domain-containing protein [Cellulomonas fimi]|uniref:Iron sulfur-containing domain, CDGSH-type n=1 Tax=Cellulomonas fimi (strain ATCC 484 / DSM 20113 / JCM 1341 / CCUG 24087 / LMG 16345 / NBRC 15513 / NCIMB 8980 / NCTC 7547 / NRS-133) TaxID=590998 RepID=F4H0X4_CELFA|nr:CDGSH iron-sulfur domain-containing protein [Cellulomonas fimi]AEE46221.1 Iron sulfur-containing domain, CDGSH-type [Cellulomonas fimi ATCC 484]VEH32116.1 Uncharacterized conserved protein [Cellulomonas fimi]
MSPAGPHEGAVPRGSIVACPDGPLLVRGDVPVVDDRGNPVEKHRATVALCRCGASAIKPWCDGSHKAIGFEAP